MKRLLAAALLGCVAFGTNALAQSEIARTMVLADKADRTAFTAPIYPNMAPLAVPADAPPMFVAIAEDDFLLAREKGFPLIESYRAAGRPIEFHLFPSGGHGFGIGAPGTPEEGWIELLYNWMRTSGFLTKAK